MKNLNQHVKSDKVKWIITGIALVLILAILGGVLAAVLTETNPKDWFEQSAEEKTETPDVTDGDGNEMESGKVYPMPSSMIFATTAAESGITVKATVTPDNATNKNLIWSVEWVNPSSSWATGKTVSEYISLVKNGTDTATVSCLQAFGEQAKIVVTSESNSAAKAECTLDYAQRITADGIDFTIVNGSDGVIDFENNSLLPLQWIGSDTDVSGMELKCETSSETSVYTLADSYDVSVEVSIDLRMFATYAFIGNLWIEIPYTSMFLPDVNTMEIAEYADAFSYEGLCAWWGALNSKFLDGSATKYTDFLGMVNNFIATYPKIVDYIAGGDDPSYADLAELVTEDFGGIDGLKERMGIKFTVTVSGEYSSASREYYGYFDVSYMETFVENITLDNESVVF